MVRKAQIAKQFKLNAVTFPTYLITFYPFKNAKLANKNIQRATMAHRATILNVPSNTATTQARTSTRYNLNRRYKQQTMTSDEENGSDAPDQCFTSLQSRDLAPQFSKDTSNFPRLQASLCPSMDLIAYSYTPKLQPNNVSTLIGDSNLLSIYRIVSWQKLIQVSSTECVKDGVATGSVICAVCWSPDGRACVVGHIDGSVSILNVEDEGKTVHSLEGCEGNGYEGAISGLVWAKRVIRPGAKSPSDLEGAWSMCHRHYLDRVDHFFPICTEADNIRIDMTGITAFSPSLMGNKANNSTDRKPPVSAGSLTRNGTSTLPSCGTPLSMLCVSNNMGDLSLYLHGRYLISRIKHNNNLDNRVGMNYSDTEITIMSDLSSLLVSPHISRDQCILYDLPEIASRNYELNWISSSHCFIGQQLQIAGKTIKSAAKAFKDCLRPLDLKFTALRSLLKDYDVVHNASPRSELLGMILTGSSKSNKSSDSCLRQFFSNNISDQALQRIVKITESGVATIESKLRSSVLTCAHAIFYAASEMYGLAKASIAWNDSIPLIYHEKALEFQRSAGALCFVTEQCLLELVIFRYRLKDLLRWFSGTAANVKAEVCVVIRR